MERRTFFQWVTFTFTRLARAQTAGLPADDIRTLRDLAGVVLPNSLGRERTDKIVDQFDRWIREYKPGSEISSGYGFPRVQVIPPSPAVHYPEQLRQLETAAAAKGASFGKLDAAARREIVEAALAAAKVDNIPPRPNGRHIVADLMSYFYNSSAGEDHLYGVAIRRDDCRGLATSGNRPEPLA
jgi:hypothetical protein